MGDYNSSEGPHLTKQKACVCMNEVRVGVTLAAVPGGLIYGVAGTDLLVPYNYVKLQCSSSSLLSYHLHP